MSLTTSAARRDLAYHLRPAISEAEIDELTDCFAKARDDTWAMIRERGLV